MATKDFEMARYVLAVLLNSNRSVFFSWGVTETRVIENGLQFNTNGYIHQGKVQVVYDEGADLFTVRTLNADGTTKEEREGIYFDQLQETVDRLVECDNEEAYKQAIEDDPFVQMVANAREIIVAF